MVPSSSRIVDSLLQVVLVQLKAASVVVNVVVVESVVAALCRAAAFCRRALRPALAFHIEAKLQYEKTLI